MNLIVALLIVICAIICNAQEGSIYINELPLNSKSTGFYTIEGRVFPAPNVSITPSWFTSTRIIVNYGQFLAFMRKDGSFEINQVPSGSYLVEVTNPDLFYKPTRVDINSKGKIRARKVNYIQSSAVQQISYPLRYRPQSPFKYFQTRETWRITDFLFNPMVLMMVLPLILIMVLPKMMNVADVETQREIQNRQIPAYDVPELSEMMTNWFNSGASSLNKPDLAGMKTNKLTRKR